MTLTEGRDGLADPRFRLDARSLQSILNVEDEDLVVDLRGARLRLHRENKVGAPVAVLLPLDQLFDIRAAAALRLWRALAGRTPGPDPGALTPERRGRLILALRALDGRLERATYPEIAAALFDTAPVLQARLDFARIARSDRPARPARILDDAWWLPPPSSASLSPPRVALRPTGCAFATLRHRPISTYRLCATVIPDSRRRPAARDRITEVSHVPQSRRIAAALSAHA